MSDKLLLIDQSPEDSRDYKAEEHLDMVFSKDGFVDHRKSMLDVRNQGSQGSCAAMSAAAMKEWQESLDINLKGYMSPQFIYNLRENKDKQGMHTRDLMKILKENGCVAEEFYPYGSTKNISGDLLKRGKNHAIKGYARIASMEELDVALNKNGPCIIAVPVYNHGKRMWFKEEGQKYSGGHAMLIVGRNSKGYIIRNSWGKTWGDKGHCIFPYDDWGKQWEVWTTIDADSNKPDFKYKISRLFYKVGNFIWAHKFKFGFLAIFLFVFMPILIYNIVKLSTGGLI